MKAWRSFYEVLKFPIEVIVFAVFLCTAGNLMINTVYGLAASVENDYVQGISEMFIRTGSFLLVNFPLFFLYRMTARKNGSSAVTIAGFCGYIAFAAATAFSHDRSLTKNAYSSILGMAITNSEVSYLSGTVYPLQTGLFGALIAAGIALMAYARTKRRHKYGFFGFLSREVVCVMRTTIWCMLAGVAVSLIWPFGVKLIEKIVHFISVDTSNPVNLILYGITERVLYTFNLSNLIRQPFWFGAEGGNWVSFAGIAYVGDVNVWTAEMNGGALASSFGKFITPYYVINIFAIPGMLAAIFFLQTDPVERRREFPLMLVLILLSMLGGISLPVQLMLLFLCPFLFVFHVTVSGMLFGILHMFRAYIGYSAPNQNIISAMPGTLPELIHYLQYPRLLSSIIIVLIAGVVCFLLYFLMTRIYFTHLASDLFHTGEGEKKLNDVLKALGGIENVKNLESDVDSLTVLLYDESLIQVSKLRRLGAYRIYQGTAGYSLHFGADATMLRRGMESRLREPLKK